MMKTKLILAISAVALTAAAAYAVASDDDRHDNGNRDGWLSRQQIEAQLNQMGYQVQRLEADDGCFEAYVTDPNGVRAEVYVDPTTGTPGCRAKHGEHDD